jgi:coenzyme PQQ biosynthesis protein PqqD
MTPELHSKPRLAPGCRVSDAPQNLRVLHMPGRDLRLQGPSIEIVELCDGNHTVQQIVAELHKLYPRATIEKMQDDILGYLAMLHAQHALIFE